MSSTLMILIDFIFRLATLLFLTRFLLQISGADFYNPISQAVVKASDTICKPLRAFIKPIQNIDLASFIAAWLICIISVAAFTLLQYNTAPDPLLAIGAGFIKTLLVLTQFYKWTLIIIVIASFVAQGTRHPALELLNQLLEPIMGRIRSVLPSLGPLDLSPMVVLLLIILIEDILMRVSF